MKRPLLSTKIHRNDDAHHSLPPSRESRMMYNRRFVDVMSVLWSFSASLRRRLGIHAIHTDIVDGTKWN